jgi:hypothetical protein
MKDILNTIRLSLPRLAAKLGNFGWRGMRILYALWRL